MAKKRKDSQEEDNVFQEASEAPKQEQIQLGDSSSLKRTLDDAVIEALSEAGCRIDNTYTDLKIAIGLQACGVACLAQFYPQKYPDNLWLLLICVSTYVALSTLMAVVAAVYEKDATALTRAVPGGPPGLAISTRLPRFQETYTLRIAPRGAGTAAPTSGGGSGGCEASGAVSLSRGVGEYFHEDGYLAAEVIKRDTQQLLQRLVEAKSK